MKYKQYLESNNIDSGKAFEYLSKTFIPTIASYNFLVDWKKVDENKKTYELLLNNLNFLLNKKDSFKEDFEFLVRNNPKVIEAFPILLATREKNLEFIDDELTLKTKKFNFTKPNLVNIDIIEHYYRFIDKTGLKDLFCNYNITNLVDYVFGVEVGLNSNARKNRTGTSMENIVNSYIKEFCLNNSDYIFIEQATQKNLKELFDYSIIIDKNNRRFDFALFNKKSKKLYLMEVNFYSGGGSKLKATAGEYKDLEKELKKQNITFIWITDGNGWKTALNPLEETFYSNDYVINLNMLKNGILDFITK